MKTPTFWNNKNIISTLLLPLSLFYWLGSTLRPLFIKPIILPVPVICVGNLTAGGSGKTPVALAIGERLKQKGISAFFLSRGYGGSARGPLLVDPIKHSAAQVGDEPLLLAGVLPTIVAKDRVAGARLAISQGANVIIMDDGLQNSSIAKTLSLLAIDGQTGLGNQRLLPAGPLRQALRAGMRKVNALIMINETKPLSLPGNKPVIHARTSPRDPATLRDKKLLAFCGIAYPQKFFSMLERAGAKLTESIAFADHHPYSNKELEALQTKATAQDAQLATTTKDAVRLPETLRSQILVVDLSLTFDNVIALDSLLEKIHGKN